MLIKIIAIAIFIIIIVSLGVAFMHLVRPKDSQHSLKTAQALTVRIGLSLLLFIVLFIAFRLGWFAPQGIGSRIHPYPMVTPPPAQP